jgi:uncharacterized membrane protein YgaE (UPF0421/DUF939 family)
MKRSLESLYGWFIGFDPGFTRLEKAGLAALSFLSAWIITREILQTFAAQLPTPVYMKLVIFAPVLSLIGSIVISDVHPVDRRNSLLLSILPVAAVLASFTLLPAVPLIYALILVVLFFFSYYFRRFGIKAMELFLIATVTFYFAALLGIAFNILPWFLLVTLISVFSVYLWRFVLIPYNPERLLRRTNSAYYRQAAGIITDIIRTVQQTPPHPGWARRLQTGLSRISRCRKVIESELGALTPPVWTQGRLDRLRIDFYNAEQGIALMVEAISVANIKYDQIPEDIRQNLLKTLTEFREVLIRVASPQSVENLEIQYRVLRDSINYRMKENPTNTWSLPLLRLIAGGSQVNRAVKDSRDVVLDRGILIPLESGQPVNLKASADKKEGVKVPKPQVPGGKKGINLKALHPTTILGLQASLAVFVSTLVAYFFSLDHSNWVFWTAFVVIAGSTGESLRRMSFRVSGTIVGVIAGVSISLVLSRLNTGSFPVVGVIAACFFLAAYFVDTSYIWMIFWINIAVTLLFIALGGTVADILVTRPLNTFIGAAIAALVVLFVLPIRTGERFKRTLEVFMNTLAQYITSYTGRLMRTESPNLESVNMEMNVQYAKLEQTFPTLALEYNPLARAQTPLLQLSTILQTLKADLSHMTRDSDSGLIDSLSGEITNLITAIRERIHENIKVIINLLNKRPSGEVRLLTDLFAKVNQVQLLERALDPDVDENPTSETHVLIYLARVNQSLYQIASDLNSN